MSTRQLFYFSQQCLADALVMAVATKERTKKKNTQTHDKTVFQVLILLVLLRTKIFEPKHNALSCSQVAVFICTKDYILKYAGFGSTHGNNNTDPVRTDTHIKPVTEA